MLVITPSGPAVEGQAYSLMCDLMGDESLAVSETRIRWDKVTSASTTEAFHGAIYSIATLSRDDAGEYNCVASITSPYLNGSPVLTQTVTINLTRKCTLDYNYARPSLTNLAQLLVFPGSLHQKASW